MAALEVRRHDDRDAGGAPDDERTPVRGEEVGVEDHRPDLPDELPETQGRVREDPGPLIQGDDPDPLPLDLPRERPRCRKGADDRLEGRSRQPRRQLDELALRPSQGKLADDEEHDDPLGPRRARPAGQREVIERLRLPNHVLGRQSSGMDRAPGLAEPPPEGGVEREADDRLRERPGIAGRNHEPRDAVAEYLAHAAHVGGDAGDPGRHRLEDRDREPLPFGGEDEGVGGAHEVGDVGPLTQEQEPASEAEPSAERRDVVREGPRADKREDRLDAAPESLRGGLEEPRVALLRRQAPHGEEDDGLRRDAQLPAHLLGRPAPRQPPGVDSVSHGDEAATRDPASRDVRPPHGVGDRDLRVLPERRGATREPEGGALPRDHVVLGPDNEPGAAEDGGGHPDRHGSGVVVVDDVDAPAGDQLRKREKGAEIEAPLPPQDVNRNASRLNLLGDGAPAQHAADLRRVSVRVVVRCVLSDDPLRAADGKRAHDVEHARGRRPVRAVPVHVLSRLAWATRRP
jgi:hypothetical protein